MNCSNCNQDKFIVNKKHNLCDDCNFSRLHDGKTKSEVYLERHKNKPKKIYQLKTTPLKRSNKPIKQQTTKQRVTEQQLSELKKDIELEALQSNNYYCWGCGKGEKGLDKSHILSVKQRKDLELIKENINLLCRTCHNDWESWDILRMLKLDCFEKDLQFIKHHDIGIYNKLLDGIHYHLVNDQFWSENNSKLLDKAEKIYSDNDFIIK